MKKVVLIFIINLSLLQSNFAQKDKSTNVFDPNLFDENYLKIELKRTELYGRIGQPEFVFFVKRDNVTHETFFSNSLVYFGRDSLYIMASVDIDKYPLMYDNLLLNKNLDLKTIKKRFPLSYKKKYKQRAKILNPEYFDNEREIVVCVPFLYRDVQMDLYFYRSNLILIEIDATTLLNNLSQAGYLEHKAKLKK